MAKRCTDDKVFNEKLVVELRWIADRLEDSSTKIRLRNSFGDMQIGTARGVKEPGDTAATVVPDGRWFARFNVEWYDPRTDQSSSLSPRGAVTHRPERCE